MRGLRFVYERDGADMVITVKAEDDDGKTWMLQGRVRKVSSDLGDPRIMQMRERLKASMVRGIPLHPTSPRKAA